MTEAALIVPDDAVTDNVGEGDEHQDRDEDKDEDEEKDRGEEERE